MHAFCSLHAFHFGYKPIFPEINKKCSKINKFPYTLNKQLLKRLSSELGARREKSPQPPSAKPHLIFIQSRSDPIADGIFATDPTPEIFAISLDRHTENEVQASCKMNT